MKKFIKYLSAAVAGVALATVVALAGNAVGKNIAYADAAPCIKAVQAANGEAITFDGPNGNKIATAKMRLKAGCGDRTLVMKSYYAQSSTGKPHEGQYLYAQSAPQVYTDASKNCLADASKCKDISVAMFSPSCFYQVDIVEITPQGNNVAISRTGGDHDCTPTPTYSCVSMAAKQSGVLSATITDYQITAHNATYLRTTVQWGDTTSDTRVIPQGMGHTYPKAGQYTITATSYFHIAGQFGGPGKEVAAAPCTYQITITPEVPNKIQVCELATKNIITIDEKDFDASKYSKILSDCAEAPKQIFVCEISTKNILTIREDEFGTAKYPTDKYSKNLDLCVPKNITVCDLATKSLVTIEESQFDASKHTTDLTKCQTTVTPPAKLVNTGPGSTVALAGATGIVAAAAHAFWRRRNV